MLVARAVVLVAIVFSTAGLPTAVVAGSHTSDRDQASADLKAVTRRVESLQEELAKQRKEQSQAEQDLARIEKAAQAARRELNDIRKQQKAISQRQAELERQAKEQEAKLAKQRQLLGEQLRAAYVNGREEMVTNVT